MSELFNKLMGLCDSSGSVTDRVLREAAMELAHKEALLLTRDSEIAVKNNALAKAADKFEYYEINHRAKATALHQNWRARSTEQENLYNEAAKKADTNRDMAKLCKEAL